MILLVNDFTASAFGDIERFDNPSKLVAYAGLDASVSQSGEYEASSGKLSKRGSPYLRKALYMAAQRAEFCDPVFHAYYEKNATKGSTILWQQMLLPGSFAILFMLF